MVIINAVHLTAGGNGYEHIESVKYITPGGAASANATVAQVIEMIRRGIDVFSQGYSGAALARVHIGNNGRKEFIESKADSTVNNNLLVQPKF